jgi:WD40 repeat protein
MRLRSSTIASKKRTAEVASLDDHAPRNCDTTPDIPINLISHLVLPFLQDRPTWNAVCSANKELHEAGMSLTPPWPATKLELGQSVGPLKFSPCGSFLASGTSSSPYLLYIWDRRGRQTCLRGHTSEIRLLSFSNDGNYLASAGSTSRDSIRIWPTDATTRLPQQSDKQLGGHHHQHMITCLDFSPADSNILASGHYRTIKLWNVEQEVCIYSFDHTFASIQSLYFPVEDEGHKCMFVTSKGSLIWTHWGGDLSDIESDIVDMPGLDQVWQLAFSYCGSLLAAVSADGTIVTLFNMRTMTVVQRLTIPRSIARRPYTCLAFSPDDKTLVLYINYHEIHIYEVPDLNIKRLLLQPDASENRELGAVAFDPSGQFLASAGGDEIVRLWTL